MKASSPQLDSPRRERIEAALDIALTSLRRIARPKSPEAEDPGSAGEGVVRRNGVGPPLLFMMHIDSHDGRHKVGHVLPRVETIRRKREPAVASRNI